MGTAEKTGWPRTCNYVRCWWRLIFLIACKMFSLAANTGWFTAQVMAAFDKRANLWEKQIDKCLNTDLDSNKHYSMIQECLHWRLQRFHCLIHWSRTICQIPDRIRRLTLCRSHLKIIRKSLKQVLQNVSIHIFKCYLNLLNTARREVMRSCVEHGRHIHGNTNANIEEVPVHPRTCDKPGIWVHLPFLGTTKNQQI